MIVDTRYVRDTVDRLTIERWGDIATSMVINIEGESPDVKGGMYRRVSVTAALRDVGNCRLLFEIVPSAILDADLLMNLLNDTWEDE